MTGGVEDGILTPFFSPTES